MSAHQSGKGIGVPVGNERTEQLPIGTFADGSGENDPPELRH
jgi:hypothetical protein